MEVTIDYSGSFFKTDLAITADSPNDGKQRTFGDEATEIMNIVAAETSPSLVDFSRKDSTTYLFKGIHSGSYIFKLHQSFKKTKSCQATVAVTIRTWESGKSDIHL